MKVKAAPGVKVPMDGAPRKYITDGKEVDVDATPYYLLRLKDGDLVRTDTADDTAAPVDATGVTNAPSVPATPAVDTSTPANVTNATSSPVAAGPTKVLPSPATGVVTER